VLNDSSGDIHTIMTTNQTTNKAYNITNKYSIMKTILEEQERKISILLEEVYEENDIEGISYYSGQRDLIYNLLSLCIE
jgi:hypothetical protein